jgi:hypothetical protein
MKTTLTTIDSAFTSQYRGLLETQRNIKQQLETYTFDLSTTEITDAVVERMLAFWYFNVNNNKEILGREINTTSADFFTESCLLFLKSYYEQKEGFKVLSERNITNGNKIRPDISIWKNSQLVAVIELKVSDGWKGKMMSYHLKERQEQISALAPDAFFGVLAFWNFFDIKAEDWNTKHFGLLYFDKGNNHQRTDASIEKLILEINKHI